MKLTTIAVAMIAISHAAFAACDVKCQESAAAAAPTYPTGCDVRCQEGVASLAAMPTASASAPSPLITEMNAYIARQQAIVPPPATPSDWSTTLLPAIRQQENDYAISVLQGQINELHDQLSLLPQHY